MLDKLVGPAEPFDGYRYILLLKDFKDCGAKATCQDVVFQGNHEIMGAGMRKQELFVQGFYESGIGYGDAQSML